ncbi:MAG: tetratricopeptide repeat protein [Deltaproteobacteria bacterium]|nr:tetratricopeptide repeat protein [Deltaproteobacteria bacterium]MBW1719092.1 tetratricopeptide repeat protein [Deltaproteobacteria bacterium]MBW1932146.1 tetratricopeptide repeat protein [Deltaproteobacteria bacterium]MBW1937703.1 tetratricopeptide repeat protein [Deltaproteobacteria bacterium]MBW1964737.1 tetratricopeptide repeat protein [Deltaproteobacteria bacterium]
MGCQRKISYLLIVFLAGVFWWMSDNSPAMGNEPNQSRPEQNDISHWIAELESSLPNSRNNTEPDGTEDVTASKVGETSGNNPAAKLVNNDAKDKISVDLFKVDLHNVFRLLGQVSGKNIVVDEMVKGTITLALENVPWTFVLDVIKNLKGLDSIERHNTIMIYPTGKSLEWGGDAGSGAILDVQIEPLLIEKEQELIIDEDGIPVEGKQKSGIQIERIVDIQTPIEHVTKAQDLINKAAKLEKQGAIGPALKLYIEASDIWPENVSLAKKISALALGPGGQELTSFNFARKTLRFAPKDSEAITFAATALARMGKKDEAKIYFERAMDTASIPGLHTLYNYAVFCESGGEYRQALRLLNNIEINYELSADAMLLRARVFEHLGQIDKAITEYRAVLQGGESIPPESQRYAKGRMEILMTAK